MKNKKKNILIVGGSGFIGKHLCCKLSKKNKIYILDLKKNDNSKNQFKVDIRNKIKKIKGLNKIDLIINLAAIHKEPGHKNYEYFETNIKGAENICEFAESVKCQNIIFTSSIAPYGIRDKLKNEQTTPCPVTAYGSSKLAAEKIHIAWQNRDMPNRILTIVRPGIVFGKGEKANMYRLIKLIHKRFFFYMGNRNTAKASIYVKELVDQIMWVNQKQEKKEISKNILFNAAMWPNPTIQDYVETICKVSNISRSVPSVPYFFMLLFSYLFEIIFKLLRINNLFSPIRLSKLIRSNLIKPSFLINNKYRFKYSLKTAFHDWKKEDKETWVN
ncbi:NAD-dependent epimerase/dehydratase family protein [Candidatus Pelagibacter sp. Uisw_113]|uniref:NAD-dependent epimerase/dehydratase family protein n=1 Tax=Candidatus Pelagibacter sp. Uisw_113 TaxID=3230994 RepID=UPI0039E8319D